MSNNLSQQDLLRKQAVSKFKNLMTTKRQWDGFCDYLDILISEHHRKLEQSDNTVSIHRAQGAIEALRYLKYLQDEAEQ